MNRDRDPTQVIGVPSTPTLSSTTSHLSSPTITVITPSTPSSDPLTGLSKIKATALLLKQKVAGTNTKPQKQPNKISHPWSLTSSSTRSASFPSPTSSSPSPSSIHSPLSHTSTTTTTSSTHSLGHLGLTGVGSGGGSGGKAGIKAMIAAREDPSLSCNKMAPPGTQPIPAPQQRREREPRAGMTKVQLSQPSSQSTQSPQSSSTATVAKDRNMHREQQQEQQQQQALGGQDRNDGQRDMEEEEEKQKRTQKKRESIQEQSPLPTTTTPTTPTTATTSAALESIHVVAPEATESTADSLAGKGSSRRRNGGAASLVPSQFSSTTPSPSDPSASLQLAFMKAFEDTRPIETVKTTRTSEEKRRSLTSALPPSSPSLVSPPASSATSPPTVATATSASASTAAALIATGKTQPASPSSSSVFEQRPSRTPRRHTTTNSPSSPLSSSPFFLTRHLTPSVPALPVGMTSHGHQPMNVTNPTLRQLQTPNIPTNLVQARILQQEEQKRKDEELAKIPITANLRTVKKIQAVLVSDDEGDDVKGKRSSSSTSSSASSSLSAGSSMTRPRSKTATSTSSVMVSTLVGWKRRGDRNHIEPVAIPKQLADQVEHILGRKLAGKGSVLDEREKEREEEEVRKAAEPLPPIVLGKPRKRAVTSAHIQNLVSSWDTKVEEAKELTSEAERIRLFLEERSTAHAEMPKPKHAPTAEELLRPLPALPPPPSPSELNQLLASGSASTNNVEGGSGTVGRRRGRTVATSTGSNGRGFGHTKGASVASASPSTTVQPQQKTKILLSPPSQSSGCFVATSSSKKVVGEMGAGDAFLGAELPKQQQVEVEVVVTKDVESTRTPAISAASLETKRTGEILVSKAAISRPRRKGVRNPSISKTQE